MLRVLRRLNNLSRRGHDQGNSRPIIRKLVVFRVTRLVRTSGSYQLSYSDKLSRIAYQNVDLDSFVTIAMSTLILPSLCDFVAARLLIRESQPIDMH